MRNKFLVINYIFILSVILLFINDHFLKLEYHNWLTGKLSDFLGMIIFPLFLAYLFPKLKTNTIPITIILFIFWKSPFSQSFINFYNEFAFIKITRVVDYTDLIAFLFLPIPYFFIKNEKKLNLIKINNINTSLIIVPSILIMLSTSPPKHYGYNRAGYLYFYNYSFKIKNDENIIINELKKRNLKIHKDTLRIISEYNNYKKHITLNTNLDSLKIDTNKVKSDLKERVKKEDKYIIYNLKIGNDLIEELRFDIEENYQQSSYQITLISAKIEKDLTETGVNRKLSKWYRKLIKEEFFKIK